MQLCTTAEPQTRRLCAGTAQQMNVVEQDGLYRFEVPVDEVKAVEVGDCQDYLGSVEASQPFVKYTLCTCGVSAQKRDSRKIHAQKPQGHEPSSPEMQRCLMMSSNHLVKPKDINEIPACAACCASTPVGPCHYFNTRMIPE